MSNNKVRRLHKRNNKRWLNDLFWSERLAIPYMTPIMFKKDDISNIQIIYNSPMDKYKIRYLSELKHPYKMSRTKQKRLFLKINNLKHKKYEIRFKYKDKIRKWSLMGYVVEKLGRTVTE